jgi:RHS repeat-associated protein
VDQPYTYTGREFDAETGLYFLRMRMYDPLIGRFSQKDPRGFNGRQLNLCQYNYNEPMDFTDPSGGIPRGLSKPVDPFKDPSRVAYACAQKVVKMVWADAKTQGWRGNDKRVHCVVSCVATKKCGAGVAFGAGMGREAGQLFIQGKILSWNDGIVDSALDEEANIYGITCPLNEDCYQRCSAKY